MTEKELKEKIKNAEEKSRNSLLTLLKKIDNNLLKNIEITDITSDYDFIYTKNNHTYIIEQKHRENYEFKSKTIQEGLFIDSYKFKKLINHYYQSNEQIIPVYTSTFKEDNVIVWINLNKLPISEIIQDINDLSNKLNDRIKYLEDMGEEPNKYNMSHLNNKWCSVKQLPKTYVKGDKSAWKVEVRIPLPNINNKYGKIYELNE